MSSKTYLELVGRTRRTNLDNSYKAAFYLLAADEDVAVKAIRHVTSDGVDFEEMLAQEVFSSGEERMVRIAYSLFSHEMSDVSIWDLTLLSYSQFGIVIEAILVAKGDYVVVLEPDGPHTKLLTKR